MYYIFSFKGKKSLLCQYLVHDVYSCWATEIFGKALQTSAFKVFVGEEGLFIT